MCSSNVQSRFHILVSTLSSLHLTQDWCDHWHLGRLGEAAMIACAFHSVGAPRRAWERAGFTLQEVAWLSFVRTCVELVSPAKGVCIDSLLTVSCLYPNASPNLAGLVCL